MPQIEESYFLGANKKCHVTYPISMGIYDFTSLPRSMVHEAYHVLPKFRGNNTMGPRIMGTMPLKKN